MTRRAYGARLFRQLQAFDRRWVAAGFPPLSPWWLASFGAFLESGARRLCVRCGRQGGKSTSVMRLLVVIALVGIHEFTPGVRLVIPILSISREESSRKIPLLASLLDAVGEKYERTADSIALARLPIDFRVYANNFRTAVGFSSPALFVDELARWPEDGEVPADEVITSLVPSTATQSLAFEFYVSSAFGLLDAHAQMMEVGTNEHQHAVTATTWEANPSITEERTHEIQPDARKHAREFGSIPSATASSAFDLEAIDRAFAPRDLTFCRQASPAMVIDPSSGRADSWTYAVVRWVIPKVEPEYIERIVRRYEPWRDEGARIVEVSERVLTSEGAPIPNPDYTSDPPRPFLRFEEVGGWEGRFYQQLRGDAIVDQLATICRQRGIVDVHADQRESLMLASAFTARGLRYHSHAWTAENKTKAVATVRRWMRDDELSLCDHAALRTQLLQFEERITSGGAFTYGARGGRHDDYVALLVTAALADEAGNLPFSALARPRIRRAMPWGHTA